MPTQRAQKQRIPRTRPQTPVRPKVYLHYLTPRPHLKGHDTAQPLPLKKLLLPPSSFLPPRPSCPYNPQFCDNSLYVSHFAWLVPAIRFSSTPQGLTRILRNPEHHDYAKPLRTRVATSFFVVADYLSRRSDFCDTAFNIWGEFGRLLRPTLPAVHIGHNLRDNVCRVARPLLEPPGRRSTVFPLEKRASATVAI
jgi:hypothetical protein